MAQWEPVGRGCAGMNVSLDPRDATIAKLRSKVRELTDRIVEMESAYGFSDDVMRWGKLGLSPDQGRIMNTLMKADIVSVPHLTYALYGELADQRPNPELTARVQVCHCRRKLSAHGIVIQTLPCHGRRLPPESKQKLEELLS